MKIQLVLASQILPETVLIAFQRLLLMNVVWDTNFDKYDMLIENKI